MLLQINPQYYTTALEATLDICFITTKAADQGFKWPFFHLFPRADFE